MFFKVLSRIFGGFFKSIGHGFGGMFRWISRHEGFLGFVVVVVAAFFGIWLLLSILNVNIVFGPPPATQVQVVSTEATPATTPTPAPPPTPLPVTRTNAPGATEAFMIGQINGNADQVWNAMSANLHNKLAGEGHDKSYFERNFADLKRSGFLYDSYQYVGGVASDNGTSIHFYVMNVSNSEKRSLQVPWTFVVDKDGKIIDSNFAS